MDASAHLAGATELDPRYEPRLAKLRYAWGGRDGAYRIWAFTCQGREIWVAARRDSTEDDGVLEEPSAAELTASIRIDYGRRPVPKRAAP
jgi:hypothetical protein